MQVVGSRGGEQGRAAGKDELATSELGIGALDNAHQDALAAESHRRAAFATEAGYFAEHDSLLTGAGATAEGSEGSSALLSNASACCQLLGPPEVSATAQGHCAQVHAFRKRRSDFECLRD